MGIQYLHRFRPNGVPSWNAIRDKLAATGVSPLVRMIDGMPAFPDEVPAENWGEVRISLDGSMVTLRKVDDGIEIVTWGTADPALEVARSRVGRALEELATTKE